MTFRGLRVLSLESRRASEMAELIRRQGGEPFVAPSMREVPLAENGSRLPFCGAGSSRASSIWWCYLRVWGPGS